MRQIRTVPDHEAARRGIEWIRKHYRRALAIGAAGLLNAFSFAKSIIGYALV